MCSIRLNRKQYNNSTYLQKLEVVYFIPAHISHIFNKNQAILTYNFDHFENASRLSYYLRIIFEQYPIATCMKLAEKWFL